MKIDLENGGWLEGDVEIEPQNCGSQCHTCECPPIWRICYVVYKADGTKLMVTSTGSQANPNDPETAHKDLESYMRTFAHFANEAFRKKNLG